MQAAKNRPQFTPDWTPDADDLLLRYGHALTPYELQRMLHGSTRFLIEARAKELGVNLNENEALARYSLPDGWPALPADFEVLPSKTAMTIRLPVHDCPGIRNVYIRRAFIDDDDEEVDAATATPIPTNSHKPNARTP